MKLVQITHKDGSINWLNPEQVSTVTLDRPKGVLQVSIGGTTLAMPDTSENRQAIGLDYAIPPK